MTQPASPDEQTLAGCLNLIRAGEREHDTRRLRYDEAYRVYRAAPEQGADRIPKWRSRTRVPYAQNVIDTALVNIVSGLPRCLVHPRNPDDVTAAEGMQQLFDYFTSEDHLAEKQVTFAHQALICGVTVAKNHWQYADEPATEGRTYAASTRTAAGGKRIVTRDGPCFEPWSVYDCWWDPNARDVDTARYIVLRSWKTKDELERGAYDTDTGLGLYRNLDTLFKTGPGKQPSSTSQQSLLGTTDTKRNDAFELLEIWWTSPSGERCTVVGNRQVVLQDRPNPYWHGCKPIVIAQTRPDLFEMQGIPETDLVRDVQAAMHTLQNMTIDSLKLTVLRGVTYREGSVVDPNMLAIRPSFKWGVTDHTDVQPFELPQLGSDIYQERSRLLGDMERVTGISAYTSGADSSTVDQTTATGVTALQTAANTLLRFKAQQIHYKGFQRTFEQWGELIQQYLDEPVYVKVAGQEGEEAWKLIQPQDVVGSFHYRLEGSEEALSQQQERNNAIGVLNALAPYVQMGKVDPSALIERVALAFGVADPKSLVQTPPPALPPAQPNGNGGLPAAQQPLALANGTAYPMAVQNAITG